MVQTPATYLGDSQIWGSSVVFDIFSFLYGWIKPMFLCMDFLPTLFIDLSLVFILTDCMLSDI